MKAVAGLLLLLPLCQGVETSCDGRQNNTKCYGALGGSVSIQLLTDVSKIEIYRWLKNDSVILELQQGDYVVNQLESRLVITDSRTIRIDNLNRDDAGEYKREIFSDGSRTELWILQLIIQAAVSSVRLNSECLSQGEMRVSCSSEGGDSPQYSWSLNRVTLDDTRYFPGSEKSSITLEPGVSGLLLCSVSNYVSTASKEVAMSCAFLTQTEYWAVTVRMLFALLFFVGVTGALVYVHTETKQQSTKARADETKTPQEGTHADSVDPEGQPGAAEHIDEHEV